MRKEIVAQARSYLEVPWRHQGRSMQGVDCAGLIVLVAQALGLSSYDVIGYPRRAVGTSFLKHFADNLVEVRRFAAQPGDVVVFQDKITPCHCGIFGSMYGGLSVIHAFAARRKVVEEPYEHDLVMQTRAVFCFPGTEDEPWQF